MNEDHYLKDNFAPVAEETTAFDLPVKGEIPRELAGRLLRIGPNPLAPGPKHHWFVGNGLVHGVQLRDGRAEWYRSRFVRDDLVCELKGHSPTPGPRFVEFGGGGANTNVIAHAGRTYAIVEAGGNPVELTHELETVARSDFEGTLPGPFTAHPKRDPDSGELHALGYFLGWEHLQYIVVGRDGACVAPSTSPSTGARWCTTAPSPSASSWCSTSPCTSTPRWSRPATRCPIAGSRTGPRGSASCPARARPTRSAGARSTRASCSIR